MKRYIVVDDPAAWTLGRESAKVISVDDYLNASPRGRFPIWFSMITCRMTDWPKGARHRDLPGKH